MFQDDDDFMTQILDELTVLDAKATQFYDTRDEVIQIPEKVVNRTPALSKGVKAFMTQHFEEYDRVRMLGHQASKWTLEMFPDKWQQDSRLPYMVAQFTKRPNPLDLVDTVIDAYDEAIEFDMFEADSQEAKMIKASLFRFNQIREVLIGEGHDNTPTE